MTLLAFPAHYASWFPPDASKLVKLFLHFDVIVAFSCSVSWIAGRPLVAFGRLSWAFCASGVIARFAGGSCGRHEQGVTLVAGASDSLCHRLVYEVVALPGGDSQDLFLLGLLKSLFVLGLLAGRLLLWVSRALLAALVLALHAHFLVSIKGTAAVAASVHAHTDGLLDAGDQGSRSECSNPLMRLESQSILGEECAGTLLLHSTAVWNWGRLDGYR